MAGQVWVRSASAQQVILAQPSWHQRLRSVLSPALCLGGDLESVSLPSRRASVSECVNFPLSLTFPLHQVIPSTNCTNRSGSLRGDGTSWRNGRQKAPPSPPLGPQMEGDKGCSVQRSWTQYMLFVAELCPTPCDPVDCSPLGSSVPGNLQARALEWLLCPPPGHLPDPGSNLSCLLHWQVGSLTLAPPGTQFRWSQFCWRHPKQPSREAAEHIPSLQQAWPGVDLSQVKVRELLRGLFHLVLAGFDVHSEYPWAVVFYFLHGDSMVRGSLRGNLMVA